MAEQNNQQNGFAHVKISAAFLHPHTITTEDGRTFDKAFVHIPPGTKVNGVDLSGYSCDVFVSDYMRQQMLSGERAQVTLSFKADEPVPVWTGSRDDADHPYKRFEVNPWALAKGIKEQVESYKAEKAAAREEREDGLTATAKASRDASQALAGDPWSEWQAPEPAL